jgi:4-diphosphocytidyl-2-C-methyl-D-erythritol kinase
MLRLFAPAKLNLYLRVLGKRSDGYHELETLFERIDLADALTFESHPSDLTLSCDDPQLPCDETNLVLKAVQALQAATGTRQGARIHLTKRIPIGAGLGGGSSDAATTLVGLNRLWKLGLSRERLIEFGAQLGSDVPFFLGEAPFAIGRGRGERCEELTGPLPTLWHVLVVPTERLSTKAVYEGLSRELTESGPSITIVVHALRNGPALAGLASGMRNDLAPEAIRRCPIIEEIFTHLHAGDCLAQAVTGSGSAVYGLVQDAHHAEEAAQFVRVQGDPRWLVHVVKTQQEPSMA